MPAAREDGSNSDYISPPSNQSLNGNNEGGTYLGENHFYDAQVQEMDNHQVGRTAEETIYLTHEAINFLEEKFKIGSSEADIPNYLDKTIFLLEQIEARVGLLATVEQKDKEEIVWLIQEKERLIQRLKDAEIAAANQKFRTKMLSSGNPVPLDGLTAEASNLLTKLGIPVSEITKANIAKSSIRDLVTSGQGFKDWNKSFGACLGLQSCFSLTMLNLIWKHTDLAKKLDKTVL